MIRRMCKVRISLETEIVVRFDDEGKIIKTGKTSNSLKDFFERHGTYCKNEKIEVLKKGSIYKGE